MDKIDKKNNDTENRLANALLDLLVSRSFEMITVGSICKQAHLHRSTFYRHFFNIVALVRYIERELIANFTSEIQNNIPTASDNDNFIRSKNLLDYLDFVKKNRLIYNVYYTKGLFDYNMHALILKQIITLPTSRMVSSEALDHFHNYIFSVVNAVIGAWVKDNCLEENTMIFHLLHSLIVTTAQAISPAIN